MNKGSATVPDADPMSVGRVRNTLIPASSPSQQKMCQKAECNMLCISRRTTQYLHTWPDMRVAECKTELADCNMRNT